MQSRKGAKKEQRQWAWQAAPAVTRHAAVLPLPLLLRVSGRLAPFQSSLLQTEDPQSFSPLTSVHLTEVSPWLAQTLYPLSLQIHLKELDICVWIVAFSLTTP